MYATKQYIKIYNTYLIIMFHVSRHTLNSLQTATQTHHCTCCLLYRLRAVFHTHTDDSRLTTVHALRPFENRSC